MDVLKILKGLKESIEININICKNDLKSKEPNSIDYHFKKGEINGLMQSKSNIELAILLCS